ncbi:MAG: phosphoribosylformylglycinamidine synthase subunit PurS [Candidatus Zixiibacteriota bacterium]
MASKKAVVYVRLKEGVLDPQGVTIGRAIANMGYDVVDDVRSGRFFELTLSDDNDKAKNEINEICRKLLANPVIENFKVEYA